MKQLIKILNFPETMTDIKLSTKIKKYRIHILFNKYKFEYDIIIKPNDTMDINIIRHDNTTNSIKRRRVKALQFMKSMSIIDNISYGNAISSNKNNPHKIIIEDINGKKIIVFGGIIKDIGDNDNQLIILCNDLYVYDPNNIPLGKDHIIY